MHLTRVRPHALPCLQYWMVKETKLGQALLATVQKTPLGIMETK